MQQPSRFSQGSIITSNTLICEVSRLVERKPADDPFDEFRKRPFSYDRLTASRVLDMMSLCEIFVLYDTVYTLPANLTEDVQSLSLRSRLIAEGALKEFDTSPFHDRIGQAIVEGLARIPNFVAVAGSSDHIGSKIQFPKKTIEEFLLIKGREPELYEVRHYSGEKETKELRSPPRLDDTWGSFGGGSSEIEDAEYFEEMGRNLVGWIEYAGSGAYEHCTSILRDMYYIYASEQVGLPYWPQFDRLEFARKFPNYWDSFSLRERVYSRLASALEATVSEVYEDAREEIAYIPPFSALVLDRSSSQELFADALLEVRQEYSKLRGQLVELEASRMESLSLKKRRRLRRKQKELLDLAAKSFDNPGTISLEALLRYIPDLVKPVTAPLDPTKYGADLLLKPASWIKTWWKRRSISMVFRTAGRIEELERYENLLAKVFGVNLSSDGPDWKLYLSEVLKSH